ncbi:YLP motif-containing protein 1 [Gossypium australe]|uniref:YLP motif-containing protein 1 n=1 Tax=Gossypium australe TaxID=47621 RepID=A0A5B6V247_9ROSI|nr:YLP motif-containing protein 1 [Gossypium australe]
MDQYYHHQQPRSQWRQPPPPQQPSPCPVCSIPHFPFCPPYPPYHHQNPNYPQHPNYARPGFDPFQPPAPPPPPPPPQPAPALPLPPPPYINGFADPRSWHTNPNYGYDYATAGGGDVDRSYKRPRIEEGCSGPARILTEDERRLKLIRDHGAASFSGFNQENKSLHNNINNNNNVNLMPPRSSEMYNIEDSLNNYTDYYGNNNYNYNQPQQIQHKDSVPTAVNHWQGYEQRLGGYLPHPGGNHMSQLPPPPLPASPPPPLPVEAYSSSSNSSVSLFPVGVSSSVTAHSTYPVVTEPYYQNKPPPHAFHREDPQVIHRTSSVKYAAIPPKELSSDKAKFVDASELFKMPHRASRPDHIVIILRGLPGSGKSYLAKMLRDLEVENGGDAPRIHSMDDYFMTEVEKDEEIEVSKSSSSVRSKKTVKKMVMEYCYEPEMEEAYRESMLKAFKRTLEDGIFSFVIVDDRNLRVADFAQFWAIGKRSGYEVYVLEATYKDPVGCAARNVHGFTLDDIQQMAGQWEEAPSLYLQLDIKSLFHGDDLKESGIQEVDMDMEDGDHEEGLSGQQEQKTEKVNLPTLGDHVREDSSKDEKRWDAEGDYLVEVKELSRSKWSNNLDEDETEGSEAIKGNLNALSGLIQAYGNKGKSVRWSDQGGDTGFLIGAAKKAKMLSLVIGPGAGYNLKSNPLPKEESHTSNSIGNSKKQSSFQERLRAEHESFKAVFDRKKRIGGLDLDEDQ